MASDVFVIVVSICTIVVVLVGIYVMYRIYMSKPERPRLHGHRVVYADMESKVVECSGPNVGEEIERASINMCGLSLKVIKVRSVPKVSVSGGDFSVVDKGLIRRIILPYGHPDELKLDFNCPNPYCVSPIRMYFGSFFPNPVEFFRTVATSMTLPEDGIVVKGIADDVILRDCSLFKPGCPPELVADFFGSVSTPNYLYREQKRLLYHYNQNMQKNMDRSTDLAIEYYKAQESAQQMMAEQQIDLLGQVLPAVRIFMAQMPSAVRMFLMMMAIPRERWGVFEQRISAESLTNMPSVIKGVTEVYNAVRDSLGEVGTDGGLTMADLNKRLDDFAKNMIEFIEDKTNGAKRKSKAE